MSKKLMEMGCRALVEQLKEQSSDSEKFKLAFDDYFANKKVPYDQPAKPPTRRIPKLEFYRYPLNPLNRQAMSAHKNEIQATAQEYMFNNPRSLADPTFKGRLTDPNTPEFIRNNLYHLPYDSKISRELTLRKLGKMGSF